MRKTIKCYIAGLVMFIIYVLIAIGFRLGNSEVLTPYLVCETIWLCILAIALAIIIGSIVYLLLKWIDK